MNTAKEMLKRLINCSEKGGADSVYFLGGGEWLRVSTKTYYPPIQIECESGVYVSYPVSRAEAVKRIEKFLTENGGGE